MIHLTSADYVRSSWAGGSTTQLCIAPKGACYADRDFLWRVSSASVELAESDFTALPDYDRWIAAVEGGMVLTHDGGAPIRLEPYDVHVFDGGAKTHSAGCCTDFNLMLRKGKCAGRMRGIRLAAGEAQTLSAEGGKTSTLLIFCCTGSGELSRDGERLELKAGESALLEAWQTLHLRADAASGFMAAEVWAQDAKTAL